ncbi:MAG: M48 family metallopeptidase [Bacteroidetes bacterium]|nr:M48 family metallopeptidase [Bacteroidota bacterium]MBP6720961.1 M48 family metallopeptidase [Bacteroidia bacterium]
MSPSTLLTLIVALLCGSFVLDRLLDLLNLSRMKPELPEKLRPFYDEERYRKSQNYLREKSRFGLLTGALNFVGTLLVLILGGLGALDSYLRTYVDDPFLLALTFFGVLGAASSIFGMPFSLYSTFVIEEKYGFNKTTFKTWVLDKVKGALIGAVLGSLILFAFIWLVDTLKEDFWIWFWGGISLFSLGIQFFYTTLLMPLFNKLQPLEAGELRSAIEAYSTKVGFPLGNIMVMDGSKRSTKANAFFSGFGSQKRIVLYDTLIAQMSQPEILSVLAHEVGHYKRRHIILGTILGMLNIGLMLFVLSRFILLPELSAALGAATPSIHLSLIAFAMLFSPISEVTGLLMNLLSRKNEYEADAFARETCDGPALESALIKLHVETLSNLDPHPAYVFLHYSHPTLMQRISALRA